MLSAIRAEPQREALQRSSTSGTDAHGHAMNFFSPTKTLSSEIHPCTTQFCLIVTKKHLILRRPHFCDRLEGR